MLLFFTPLVREVCPNCEVVMFQPRTGTSPDLGSVAYFYVLYFLVPPFFSFTTQYPHKGETHSWPSVHTIYGRLVCPRTGSSAHQGVSYICPSMPKIPFLPCHTPNGVLW